MSSYITIFLLAFLPLMSYANVEEVADLAEARNNGGSENMETQNVVVNIYTKNPDGIVLNRPVPRNEPEPQQNRPLNVTVIKTEDSAGFMASIRDRIRVAASGFPSLPTLPPMPTLPSSVKVPVRVRVETEEVQPPALRYPSLPPLPQLPAYRVPTKVVVQQIEVTPPPAGALPGFRPIKIEYQDFKPSTPAPEVVRVISTQQQQPPCENNNQQPQTVIVRD